MSVAARRRFTTSVDAHPATVYGVPGEEHAMAYAVPEYPRWHATDTENPTMLRIVSSRNVYPAVEGLTHEFPVCVISEEWDLGWDSANTS